MKEHEIYNANIKELAIQVENLEEYVAILKEELELARQSLRDQFAMAALQGLISSGQLKENVEDQYIAEASYVIADAMIEVRKV